MERGPAEAAGERCDSMGLMTLRSAVRDVPGYRVAAHAARVKLDQNESPYDLPADLRDRAFERLHEASLNRYPDMHADRVRARIAELEDWPEDGVVVAGGSNVLIQALVILAGIGQRVVTVTPTFAVYALQARLLGAELTEVPLAGAALPIDALERELRRGTGVHFLTDPMAPIGDAVGAAGVERLLQAGGERWLTVVDEAYGPFAPSDHRDLVRRAPLGLSLRTLSKAYGLGGVRIGYALARPEVAAELQKTILPFSVSALQLAVAEVVLDDPAYVAERVRETVSERERMSRAFAAMPGVRVHPSVTNFLLLEVDDAERVFEGLLAEGVLVRRQDHLHGLEGCIRISVGSPSENDAVVQALAACMQHARPGHGATEVPGAAG
jgi:histidinol-phosphate aminotransferase